MKSGTAFNIYIVLRQQADPTALVTNPTIAAGDFKVSTDGGTIANLTTLPTVTPAGGVQVKVPISAAEATGSDGVHVWWDDAVGGEWIADDIYIPLTVSDVDDLLTAAGYTAPDNAGIVAIQAKTDNLPTDPADESLIIAATDALAALIGTPAVDLAADIAAVPTAIQNADALLARNQQGGANSAPTVSAALAGGLMLIDITAGVLTVKHGDGTTAYTRTLTRSQLDAIIGAV